MRQTRRTTALIVAVAMIAALLASPPASAQLPVSATAAATADLVNGRTTFAIDLYNADLPPSDDWLEIYITKDGAGITDSPYGDATSIQCPVDTDPTNDPAITNSCSFVLYAAQAAGDYDLEISSGYLNVALYAVAQLAESLVPWWRDYTLVSFDKSIFTGRVELALRLNDVPDELLQAPIPDLVAWSDPDEDGFLDFQQGSVPCVPDGPGALLCSTGSNKLSPLCIADDIAGIYCDGQDYSMLFTFNDLRVPYSYSAVLYRLSRYEEGSFFGRQDYLAGNLLQDLLDLDTFLYGPVEECFYINLPNCFELGYYDTWLAFYRAGIAALMATDGAFVVDVVGADATISAAVPLLPVGAHGFGVVVAHWPTSSPELAIETSLGCGPTSCDDATITGLAPGHYDFELRVYNNHPLVDLEDGENFFGQSLFATIELGAPILIAASTAPQGEMQSSGNNYVLADSNDLGGPDPTPSSVTALTASSAANAPDGFEEVPIGFTFPFYGTGYDNLFIGVDGLLTFDTQAISPNSGQPLSTTSIDQAAILPFLDGLDPTRGGSISYGTAGSAPDRRFVVEYNDVHHSSLGDNGVSFQIELVETDGSILIHYIDTSFGDAQVDQGAEALVGIKAAGLGAPGLQYQYRLGSLADGLTIRLWPALCAGVAATIVGGRGADTLVGTSGDDVIYAHRGDDRVVGGHGDDLICGGEGDDDLAGQRGADTIFGATGDDIIAGGTHDDQLFGGSGNDVLRGQKGADRLFGHAGDDELNGGSGPDQLFGSGGNDTLRGGLGHDFLNGGHGDDIATGGSGSDTVRGGPGTDDLAGAAQGDTVFGGSGADTIRGNGGKDRLYGGPGSDTVHGGAARDLVYGNEGDDTLFGGGGLNDIDGGSGTDSCTLSPGIGSLIRCE